MPPSLWSEHVSIKWALVKAFPEQNGSPLLCAIFIRGTLGLLAICIIAWLSHHIFTGLEHPNTYLLDIFFKPKKLDIFIHHIVNFLFVSFNGTKCLVYWQNRSNLVFHYVSSVSGWRNNWRKRKIRKKSWNHYAGHFRQKGSNVPLRTRAITQFQHEEWLVPNTFRMEMYLSNTLFYVWHSGMAWFCMQSHL